MNFIKKLFGKKSINENPPPNVDNSIDSLDIEQKFKNAIDILSPFKRTAYLPLIKHNSNTFSCKSKIGGYPYLRNSRDWPVCQNCKKNMQLFLQLNLEELPENKNTGLIQLFYCTTSEPHCESELESFFPFSEATVCRKIKIGKESKQIEPDIEELFNEKLIIDWQLIDDYPHFEEYSLLSINLDLDDDVYELMEQRNIGLPIEKDKLFGWPYWIQSVEYPYDRKTGEQMELLFQVISEDNLPYMFGDSGIGHLTQSPHNNEELGFGWACS